MAAASHSVVAGTGDAGATEDRRCSDGAAPKELVDAIGLIWVMVERALVGAGGSHTGPFEADTVFRLQ